MEPRLRGEIRVREHLTSRELSVAELIADGYKNKEIGELLQITEGTVKIYSSRAMRVLGLRNRVELALWAFKRKSAVTAQECQPQSALQ